MNTREQWAFAGTALPALPRLCTSASSCLKETGLKLLGGAVAGSGAQASGSCRTSCLRPPSQARWAQTPSLAAAPRSPSPVLQRPLLRWRTGSPPSQPGHPQPPALPARCPPESLLLPWPGPGAPTSKTRANVAWQGSVLQGLPGFLCLTLSFPYWRRQQPEERVSLNKGDAVRGFALSCSPNTYPKAVRLFS